MIPTAAGQIDIVTSDPIFVNAAGDELEADGGLANAWEVEGYYAGTGHVLVSALGRSARRSRSNDQHEGGSAAARPSLALSWSAGSWVLPRQRALGLCACPRFVCRAWVLPRQRARVGRLSPVGLPGRGCCPASGPWAWAPSPVGLPGRGAAPPAGPGLGRLPRLVCRAEVLPRQAGPRL